MEAEAIDKEPSDEALMVELASGRPDSIGPLYARYAPTVLAMAARALPRSTAEEIVQEVFLSVWKNASTFDSKRGLLRPWLLQIARHRIANELRQSKRRPQARADPDGERLARLSDPGPDPSEETWNAYRQSVLRRALEQLPPPQRQALGLAFFEELSHDQIASVLELPLGTAKSRIRAGLRTLRVHLAPLVAVLAGIAFAGALAVRLRSSHEVLSQDERALSMLTSSDSRALRMTEPGAPQSTIHGVYRYRNGSPIAVVTLSNFPPAPPGRVYRTWALSGRVWKLLGTARPDAFGHARLIAEAPALASAPEALEVTLEPEYGGTTPSGPTVVAWTAMERP